MRIQSKIPVGHCESTYLPVCVGLQMLDGRAVPVGGVTSWEANLQKPASFVWWLILAFSKVWHDDVMWVSV